MKINQWFKASCLVACLFLPLSVSAITFDEETDSAAIDVDLNAAGNPAAIPQASAVQDLVPVNGQVQPQEASLSTEVAPIAGRKTSERGVLSWIALALLGFGAFGTLLLLKNKKGTAEENMLSLEVIQSIRIGAKHQVSLVKVPGATLVLGVTEKGLQTLAELPAQSSLATANATESVREEKETAPIEEAPNPFLDKVLNMTQKSSASNPFSGMGDLSADADRRAVLKRLEQYRQTI